MPRRRADRIDENQPAIVKDLRRLGYSVITGMDDILVGGISPKTGERQSWWFEIKTGPKAPLRKAQRELEATYRGQWTVVWSVDQILAEIGHKPPAPR